MSTSANVMRLAAQELNAEDKIKVIDSANLSTGIGHQVVEAAIMAQHGKNADEIVSYIEQIKPKVRASFVVDTLVYLYRGGRCSGLAAMAGGVLKLHPRIGVAQGKSGKTTIKFEEVKTFTEEETNQWFIDNVKPDYKPPYKPGTLEIGRAHV